MLTRRQFIAGTVGAWAVSKVRGVAAAEQLLLQHMAFPQDLATPLEYYDRLITPVEAFFVRSHFGPPALDVKRRVSIDGLVSKPLDLTVEELRKFPEVSTTSVLQCAGNGRSLFVPHMPGVQWGHGAMGQAKWTGVRLKDVLESAGVQPDGAFVHLQGWDTAPLPSVPKFQRCIPLARAMGEGTILAYNMNDEPLTPAHGAPLRLIVPGWAGDNWVKWLRNLHVDSREPEGFYYQTAYRYPKKLGAPGEAMPPENMGPLTVVPVKSIIGRPLDGSTGTTGKQEVVGVAFSGGSAIAKVEVSLDGGATWKTAKLEGDPGAGRWQVFRHEFTADKSGGSFTAMSRATDAAGNTQPKDPAWNPSGYMWNGWHTVSWRIV